MAAAERAVLSDVTVQSRSLDVYCDERSDAHQPSVDCGLQLVEKAQDLARSIGIGNLLQPGLIKEMIIADILGHKLISSKRGAAACDPNDASILYEYLSCKEGGSGQLDRMFKAPPAKRAESLARITRNRKVYFAVFYKDNQIKVKAIYELKPSVVLAETERQLDRSSNDISHVAFPIPWAIRHGKLIYKDKKTN